jgi:hypothetical protein
MGQKRKRGDSSERHYIERGKQSLAIKVPGQCPLVLLLMYVEEEVRRSEVEKEE